MEFPNGISKTIEPKYGQEPGYGEVKEGYAKSYERDLKWDQSFNKFQPKNSFIDFS